MLQQKFPDLKNIKENGLDRDLAIIFLILGIKECYYFFSELINVKIKYEKHYKYHVHTRTKPLILLSIP